MGDRPDRPLFCGNFEYDAEEKEIMRMFERFGRVDRIDMKTGFAFVYMADKRDAEDAMRKLDNTEFGYKRRRLKIQWAKQAEVDRKRDSRPSCTLFVINYDVTRVRERDLDRFFDYYGPIVRIEIKKNYAFIEFEEVKDAIKALEDTNGRPFMGRTISVEYVQKENPFVNDRGGRRSPSPRGRRSPSPRGRRSPSPRGRRSLSPPRAPRRSPSPDARRRSRSP